MYIRKFEMRSTLEKNGIMHCALKYITISIKKKTILKQKGQQAKNLCKATCFFLHLEKKGEIITSEVGFLAVTRTNTSSYMLFSIVLPKLFSDVKKKRETLHIWQKIKAIFKRFALL